MLREISQVVKAWGYKKINKNQMKKLINWFAISRYITGSKWQTIRGEAIPKKHLPALDKLFNKDFPDWWNDERIKYIVHELKQLPDDVEEYEFFMNDVWVNLYFTFRRISHTEQGGEPDEILSYYKIDYIFIRDILCFKSGGESLPPDWTFAKKIEKFYNL